MSSEGAATATATEAAATTTTTAAMESKAARWPAWATIAGPLGFTFAWLVLGALRPGYSLVAEPISGLGLGEHAALMNGAFVLGGLVLFAGIVGVGARLPGLGPRARAACTFLLVLSPLGAVVCGLYTLASPRPHFAGFLLACATPVAGFLVTGLCLLRVAAARRLGGWLVLGSPLTLVLVGLFMATFVPAEAGAGIGVAGLTERLAIVEIHAWYLVLGLWTLARARPAKAFKGPAMEGLIATWYARNTRGDRRHFRACADTVAAQLMPGARVLEVAPGPGYLAIELARRGVHLTGLDISHSFVRIARDNALAEGVAVDFRHGNAAAMPFGDASFDFVVCRAAFKNFTDPRGALDEIYRVLAPGGRASIFDLRKEASAAEVEAEVASMQLSRLDAWLTRLIFRTFLLRHAYTSAAIVELAQQSRFGGSKLRRDGVSFELRLERPRG